MKHVCLPLILAILAKVTDAGIQIWSSSPQLPGLIYASSSDGPVVGGRLNTNQGGRDKKDVPGQLQYVVRCNNEGYFRTPWATQATVNTLVSYTTCSKLLETRHLTVKPSKDSKDIVYVPLVPVPRSQAVQGVKLETYLPGQVRGSMSTCCTPSACPDKCLKTTGPQKCNLMIVEPTVINDGVTPDSEWKKFFNGEWGEFGKGSSYPAFNLFMMVPCDYCPLVSCVSNCTNGEFATGYSNYVVSPASFIPFVSCLWPDTHGRTNSSRNRCRVSRVLPEPGTRAWRRPSAHGTRGQSFFFLVL